MEAGVSIFPKKFFLRPNNQDLSFLLGSDVKKTETDLKKNINVGMGLLFRSLETTPYDKLTL